jgi:hypothetical protein
MVHHFAAIDGDGEKVTKLTLSPLAEKAETITPSGAEILTLPCLSPDVCKLKPENTAEDGRVQQHIAEFEAVMQTSNLEVCDMQLLHGKVSEGIRCNSKLGRHLQNGSC